MAQPPTRDVLKILFTNFWKSFRPRQIRGNYVGEDYYGNKYFEIPANPSMGKRKSSRWFEPKHDKGAFDNDVTAEWEAWLRGRRDTPPTREEVIRNLQIMETTKRNAAELDKVYKKTVDAAELPKEIKGMTSFPQYNEYEIVPGKDTYKKQ